MRNRSKKRLLLGVETAMFLLLFITFTGCKGSAGEKSSKEEAVIPEDSQQREEETQSVENKLVIDVDGEKIYPADSEIEDERQVGDWVYFRYQVKETINNYESIYPVLFRYRDDELVAEQVNDMACYHFDVVGDYVYYMDSTTGGMDHGVLYVMRPDGQEKRKLVDELHDFQIVEDQYIYFTYRHDTVGVGLEGHALHRMNLDGSNIMIAAYEVSGADFGISHFNYKVVDGWVDCGTFKIELGESADGFEKVVFNDVGDNDWVYYIKGVEKYKIRTDGSGKEAIKQE